MRLIDADALDLEREGEQPEEPFLSAVDRAGTADG